MKILNEKDQFIAKGIVEGDRKSYNDLVERFSPVIYAECLNYCGDPDEANDHLNEILIRIVMAAGRYDPERAAIYTWIMSITRNYFINHYKKQQEEPELVFCEEDALDLYEGRYSAQAEDSGAEDHAEETEAGEYPPEVARLKQALQGVSRRDRDILLYRAKGFSYECIGEFLHIKADTAMTAYSRAVNKVREMFRDAEAV